MIPLVTLLNSNLSITMCWCCALMKLIGKPLFVSLKTTTAGLLTQSIYLRCGASLSLYRRRASKALTVGRQKSANVLVSVVGRNVLVQYYSRSGGHDGVWCGNVQGSIEHGAEVVAQRAVVESGTISASGVHKAYTWRTSQSWLLIYSHSWRRNMAWLHSQKFKKAGAKAAICTGIDPI